MKIQKIKTPFGSDSMAITLKDGTVCHIRTCISNVLDAPLTNEEKVIAALCTELEARLPCDKLET
jgi:hypothetical protein